MENPGENSTTQTGESSSANTNPDLSPASSAQATSSPAKIDLTSDSKLDRDPMAFQRAVTAADSTSNGASTQSKVADIAEAPYNQDQSRDATRQTITLWLLGLLCAIVALVFVAIFARGASTGYGGEHFFAEMKQVLDVIVGPIITLLASAVGFYFGSKQAEQNASRK